VLKPNEQHAPIGVEAQRPNGLALGSLVEIECQAYAGKK